MKVLVVGNRGMLGTDLMQAFGSEEEIFGLDLAELDITDTGQCHARVGEIRPDLILNAAALTAVDYCESHEDEALRVNGEGPGNLAAAAARVNALMVHYSTDYVFDGLKAEPYGEDAETHPRSAYGRSKLRGEELVRKNCLEHLILRTAWLFGCHGKNFIRTILKAARNGQQLRVVDDQRGSPTFTRDLAACTARMVKSGCRGTFHATNTGSCSWYELARFALECAGIQEGALTAVPTSEYPLPAPRPANSVLDNANIRKHGLQPLRSWQEAVREYINRCE